MTASLYLLPGWWIGCLVSWKVLRITDGRDAWRNAFWVTWFALTVEFVERFVSP